MVDTMGLGHELGQQFSLGSSSQNAQSRKGTIKTAEEVAKERSKQLLGDQNNADIKRTRTDFAESLRKKRM